MLTNKSNNVRMFGTVEGHCARAWSQSPRRLKERTEACTMSGITSAGLKVHSKGGSDWRC
ncbi:MAG: hypothetical protein ACTS44_01715 [Candidatus Hodgkinia cicadicola]